MKVYGTAALAAFVAPMKGNAFFCTNTPFSHNAMARNLVPVPMRYTNRLPNHPFPLQKYTPAFTRLLSTANDNDNDTITPLPDTSDPYRILNLEPTADKREIKRAYKRMALKYHPDVRTNSKSTESQKKQSNDDFSRINAAYAFLTGKSEDRPDATESEKKRGGGRTKASYDYAPPHRRSSSDRKSYSTDWQDYMPKYDETEYDAGGDSFGSIFSDLFSDIGSSDAKGSGASILNDFVSFLEGNFPSAGTKEQKEEDIVLNSLLKDGSKQEIKEEFDDAKLLVKQLEKKEFDIESELSAAVAEKESMGSRSKTYMDDMRLEEKKRELEARKDVVGDYLDRARMRQLKLRKRLQEFKKDSGSRDSGYDGRSDSRRGSTSGSTGDYTDGTTSGNYSSTSPSDGTSGQEKVDDEDAWKRESFGSSRRRRGSGRSRASRSSQSSSAGSSASGSTSQSSSSSPFSSGAQGENSGSKNDRRSSTYASSSSPSPSPRSSSGSYSQGSSSQSDIPPHRRITSRYERVQEDKRRLREIKVDEEIDKMKKELGL